MIGIEQMLAEYPGMPQDRASFLLREYLQYRILRLIYRSKHGQKLVFLGGTCLRLIHTNPRFSEDLDFDNRGLDTEQFKELGEEVQAGLADEGYSVTTEIRGRTAYRCKVRFPGLLFQQGLSGHVEQTVLNPIRHGATGLPVRTRTVSDSQIRCIHHRALLFATLASFPEMPRHTGWVI